MVSYLRTESSKLKVIVLAQQSASQMPNSNDTVPKYSRSILILRYWSQYTKMASMINELYGHTAELTFCYFRCLFAF